MDGDHLSRSRRSETTLSHLMGEGMERRKWSPVGWLPKTPVPTACALIPIGVDRLPIDGLISAGKEASMGMVTPILNGNGNKPGRAGSPPPALVRKRFRRARSDTPYL